MSSLAIDVPGNDVWFRTLMDCAPMLVWASGPDGLCTYFNHHWLQFTGRTLEQCLGEGWAEDLYPEDRSRVITEYMRSFNARQKFRLEYRLRQHGGSYRWIVDYGAPLFADDGAFRGYIGCCLDIAAQNGERETHWRQKYDAAVTDTDVARAADRIASAEVAIRERMDQTTDSDERSGLEQALTNIIGLKQKLGFPA